MPSRPAIASRCTTEFVDPPTAATAMIALRKASFVMMSLGLRSARDHVDDEPAGVVRQREQARVGGGRAREAGDRHAERLGDDGHRRGRAHRVAVALAADHRLLATR